MRISTKTRYGMRLMIKLADNFGKGYTYLKDIAESEKISEKYLSLIVIPLKTAGLLTTSRGIHGGYILSKKPSEITAREIVEILEGDMCVVECIKNDKYCSKSGNCSAQDLWTGLSDKMTEYLNTINLEELVKLQNEKKLELIDYSI
jgi:Rrf2 family protein